MVVINASLVMKKDNNIIDIIEFEGREDDLNYNLKWGLDACIYHYTGLTFIQQTMMPLKLHL